MTSSPERRRRMKFKTPCQCDEHRRQGPWRQRRRSRPRPRRTPALEREGWASFEEYPPLRDGTPLECDQETVQEVANKLRGGA